MSWETESLGNLIFESRIPAINPNPNKRIRVRLNVLGVEKRPLENEIEGATKQFIRKSGQFIYGKQNFHKGAFGIIPEELDGYETSADIPSFDVREDCLPEWIFYYFKIGNKYIELEKLARGVGSKRIHPEQISDIKIPLPDLPTQKKMLSRFKQLENSLQVINQENYNQLDFLKKLRQQILQDAVQGKLVPQDPTDEPASKLLERIKAEKEQLIKDKKIKKEKPLPEIKPEEIPFEIPEKWVWCRLGDVIELISGQDLTPNHYSEISNNGIPYITGASNLIDGKVILNRWTNNPKSIAIKGDILLTCKGSGVGKMAYLTSESAHIARQIMSIRSHFIQSSFIKNIVEINVLSYKTQAKSLVPGIDRDVVLFTPFPLPPIAEQNRIVNKIEQLRSLCNELEQTIMQSQKYTQDLLQVALKEALELK